MTSLKTHYMGIELNNPLIVSSSGLTGSVKGVRRCADAGAGAVVLKSMFEELIIAHSEELEHDIIQSEHPEAYEYLRAQIGMQLGPHPYLKFIEDVRTKVSIPVIASVNCITPKWWISYAKDIESSGADALELNISHFPLGDKDTSGDIEKRYADIVNDVSSHISIPVAVKLGYYFTSFEHVLNSIVEAGARALVLFNRYYTVDVDIEKKKFVHTMTFSSPEEMSIPLRWTGLLAGKLDCDIAVTTGIHDTESVIKMIMAGASAVQLCSVLYRRGAEYITELIEELDAWLEKESIPSVDDLRGLALKKSGGQDILKRQQYLKALEDAAKYEI
ncbi:dihydroorotate dehydrogenase-like protein [Candidatus Omnitrophota bacterium]